MSKPNFVEYVLRVHDKASRDEYFYGVAAELSMLIEVKAAEIKKL